MHLALQLADTPAMVFEEVVLTVCPREKGEGERGNGQRDQEEPAAASMLRHL